ncbi:bifunctional 4-hydroxy-2-oxoglutarate aldolase/2-dehydro-3-deoxy-phosphogluconate aldolase [Sphingomonas morindae]|uniref:2-dehydro-3-deoxy-phosphogluconate aldolase n=1 Tax=Sphingomonas morindae TaxID=1541170 RepID=A0ABY4XAW7_9SPHN|nr:bifunctional 4-hydroxy-2-oxoglutarate aldolase/2-dehydro-3-deoxy-phosphogluconate aldolase [Sphingomonas morindae]USI74117.1 bifunctional 4-hydroxy-2-oxoglutarate aldolase/2-dehydro-3-deoxy-phosphogluconate aldolase [Sphingomonas morindae]
MTLDVAGVMQLAPVIPVLVVEDVAHARPIAEALVRGGLPALEVTLRTPAALEVIREMAQVDGAVVGAGTVLNPAQMEAAQAAGARFIVSPGLTEPLAKAAIAADMPFLPGTANASDIMRGLDLGLTHFKFFPAMAAGGVPALKAILAPLHMVKICPTGGITQASAAEWLAIPQVLCVGGSWLVGKGAPDPAAIEQAARAARTLAG